MYSLLDLSTLTGVPPRTIRLWVQRGVVPHANALGPGPNWDNTHLRAIREAQRVLKDDRVSMADLAERYLILAEEGARADA